MDFRRMMKVYWVAWVVVALIGGLAVAGSVSGQTPTASIVGTVLDPQGLPVEGANVTLTNQGTNYSYTTVTNSTGGYQFASIDPGLYRVKVESVNFRMAVVNDIKLDAAANHSVVPITLEVGSTKESITVEAGAEIVNTTDTEVSSTVEKKQIDDLPILDRNPLNLLGLEAGINQNGATNTVIDGQRTSYSNMTLDGINIQDNFIRENALDFSPNLPFSSQAQEFTVINQNAGVEYGNGASQVSIVTPKGTNQFHGEGFWYYRTNAWAANNWFNDASGVSLPKLIQNQGGGNLGGPIIKDKLFVYGWYELLRLKNQAPNNTTVISPTIQDALSSATPTLPFTYTPVDANGNPAASPTTINLLNFTSNGGTNFQYATDPTMLALIKQIPAALTNNTRVGDGVNLLGYQLNARNNNTLDNTGMRVDYNLNVHNTISGTFAWNRQVVDRPDIDTSYDVVPLIQNNDSTKFLSLAWRWSPTGSITNEARFGFNLAPAFFTSSQQFGSYMLDNTTLPFTNVDSNFLPQGRNTRTWTGLDNASFTKGNHTIKFGGSVSRVTVFTTSEFGTIPTYGLGFSIFNGDGFGPSDMPAPNGFQAGTADFNNAQSLLTSVAGILSSIAQTFNVTSQSSGFVPGAPQNFNYRQNQYAIYAGDSWRISPRLTLNYGLRWDYFGPVSEEHGLLLLPVIPQGATLQQTLLSNATLDFASGNSPRGMYNGYWKGFAPNIGIAWDPFGNGKTAVRAGFSINYVNDEFFTAVNNAAVGNTGLSVVGGTPFVPSGPTVSNPMGIGAGNIASPPYQVPLDFNTNSINASNTVLGIGNLAGYGIDPNLKPPQVQQWNLSLQRDIGWNTSLQVSYVGNHGVGLFRAIDLNQLNFNAVDNNGNNFFTDFQNARANGFASVAAGNGFDPTYNCTNPCLPVFQNIYGGALGNSTINNLIYQGQVGQLIAIYHANEFDTGVGAFPGPENKINWFQNPYIMGADLLKNTSFSSWNAGIIEVRRRFNKGLYFQANYTFSKTMTDFGGSQSQFQPYQDNARPGLEKARAQFDLTHAFKANFTYELPIGRGHNLFGSPSRALGLLVNGWQTSSIFTWQSGPPFSILSEYGTFNRGGSRSVNNTAVSTLTHQQISGDLGLFKTTTGVVYVVNPKLISADGTGAPSSPQLGGCTPAVPGGFCNPQPGEIGNLQLEAFTGPAYFNWDFSAAKDFNLTERFKLTFRTDAFNILNHPTFFIGDQNINSTTFGQSTTMLSTPRILQMSLRLKF